MKQQLPFGARQETRDRNKISDDEISRSFEKFHFQEHIRRNQKLFRFSFPSDPPINWMERDCLCLKKKKRFW